MQPEPKPSNSFWTERRSIVATFLIVGVVFAAVILYTAPWRPAYIQSVDQCNLGVDQICFDVNIRFNRAVDNGTMELLAVALQNGSQTWNRAYVEYDGFSPPDELGWGVIIPVNAALITTYHFQFTLLVNGAQADARTVGYQGG